jgi:hypothetical protein
VTLDLSSSDTALRTICHDAFQHWARLIAPSLPFPHERTRASFAVLVVAALEGAFVLAKAARSGDPFRRVGSQLAAALPGPRPRRRRTR